MLKQIKNMLRELRPIQTADYLGTHRTRSLATVGSVTLVEKVFSGVIRLVSIVILSRLLPVSAFGLIAMVGFFQLFLQTISGSGLIESIVQVEDLQLDEIAGIFWVNTSLGLLLGCVLAASGPLIASFNNEPTLAPIAAALGFLFFFQNIPQTQGALLRRSMRAETQTFIVVIFSFANLFATILFAILGWGVWSIIAGSFVSMAVKQVVTSYFVRFSPWRRFSFRQISSMLSYGLKSTFGNLVGFLTLNIQTLALGKYASAADVGYYNRAQNLYQQPLKQLLWPLVGAALPAMAALQSDREKLLDLVNRATWLLNLVLAPFAILMIVAGDLVVGILLGPDWAVSGQVIRWVAIAQIPMLFSSPIARANAAIGRPARAVWLNVALLPVIIAGVVYYAPSGVVSVAIFIMIVRLLTYPATLMINLKASGMSSRTYLAALVPLWAFILVISLFGYGIRSTIEVSSLLGSYAFSLTIFLGSFIVLYFIYRNHPIGRQVLGWILSRFGRKLPFLNFLVP